MNATEWQAREDLAAAHRIAVMDQLNEGSWNHLSVVLPDRPDYMLVSPAETHWKQVTASSLVMVDKDGKAGNDCSYDRSAYYIHFPIHRNRPDAVCVLHAHPPYATALTMLKGGRVEIAEQNGAALYGRIAYYDDYGGFVFDLSHGQKLADALGDKRILFLKNHGVIVVGPTVSEAYTDLYHLERACMMQAHARAFGGEFDHVSAAVGEKVAKAADAEAYKIAHFKAMRRLLDAEQPNYRH